MNVNHQETAAENIGQSPGYDPKTSKRNSGLFSFLKWFKPSTSRESVDTDAQNSHSSSCDSLSSLQSTGTVASFSYIPPSAYVNRVSEKYINPGPETDTYKARIKQRDKRRENDKNLTLRKKYNLFFSRDTIKPVVQDEDNSKSLPLMTRKVEQEEKMHRRTASESSKVKKAGAYCHVKGKRKAPQPPGCKTIQDSHSTTSLRRKKRLAPPPPANMSHEKIINTFEYADADVIFNDSLKLDHGVLKPAKEPDAVGSAEKKADVSPNTSARSSYVEAPVSPRPWYKRNPSRDSNKKEHKYEPVERLPEVPYTRNSVIDLTAVEEIKIEKKKDDKRKSALSFLTNISELDREASEIIKKEHQKDALPEIPEFMRPKQDTKINTDSWASPKRKSARDLIAKFNAITNVTKVTVNSAFFGSKESTGAQKENIRREYFEKQPSQESQKTRKSSVGLENKPLDDLRNKALEEVKNNTPLMKSESASAIKPKSETPKFEKKSWFCPKCHLENEYWRIICYVCSAIKPYFDDLTSNSKNNNTSDANKAQDLEIKQFTPNRLADISKNTPSKSVGESPPGILERSKTQIGFSILARYNENQNKINKSFQKSVSVDEKSSQKSTVDDKKEEREKLKKMLIEMKNSLPKRKSGIAVKQNERRSIIDENPEIDYNDVQKKETATGNDAKVNGDKKGVEEKVAEVIIATKETIYENIKVKKVEEPKPVKVSSAAQTSAVVRQVLPSSNPAAPKKTPEVAERHNNFELMRPKDFANIYSDKTGKSNAAHLYQNLARNDDLSLFFNMPRRFSEIRNEFGVNAANTTDTLEINRLLRRLETAIAKGDMAEAALFAQELAQLKINCSVIRQKSEDDAKTPGRAKGDTFTIEMYVEDKISHRGPFPLQVKPDQTVRELKAQVEREFEIPAAVQRWILGKELATDDNATLKDVHITTEGCPVFLYLVAPCVSDVKADLEVKQPLKEAESRIPEKQPVKIVEEILKTDVAKPGPSNIVANGSKEKEVTPLNASSSKTIEVATKSKPELQKQEALKEDADEYDTKTLKPNNHQEWECNRCTLLNPITSRVCAVCASVRSERLEKKQPSSRHKKKAPQPGDTNVSKEQHYLQLLNLDNADLVENTEPFECVVCFLEIPAGAGVTLRECLHQFCKICLKHTIEYAEEAQVKCPYRDDQYSCETALQDREIKALVAPALYDQYLARSVTQAENKIDKSFHCKTPDCKGWCIFEDNVNEFRCPVCRRVNCLTCQAIHTGLNCKQYQQRMDDESKIDENAKRTKEMLEEMVNKGEALTCPTCQVILMKKWGCDWLRCSMCKTEICWVTRGPRWGPAGKGDTSGGCKCGVNGIKCHPQCNYCH